MQLSGRFSPLSGVDEFLYAFNSSSLALGVITLHTAWKVSSTFSWHNAFSFADALSQFDASLHVSCSTVFISVNDAICDIASLYTLSGSGVDSSAEPSDSSSRHWPGIYGRSDELTPGPGVPGDQVLIAKYASCIDFLDKFKNETFYWPKRYPKNIFIRQLKNVYDRTLSFLHGLTLISLRY